MNLRNYFDINEILTYPERFGIDIQLQGLVDSVQVPSIEIYVDDAISKLDQSDLKNFDIDKFTDNVSVIPMRIPHLYQCKRIKHNYFSLFSTKYKKKTAQ